MKALARAMLALLLGAAALLLTACGLPPNGVSALGVHLVGPQGYAVVGNRIIGPNGRPFLVHGVDRPSLEWDPSGDHLSLADFQHMAAWGANAVRISLNQDFWLRGSCAYDQGYAARVRRVVRWAQEAGITIVILDLHLSDRGGDQGTWACAVKPAQQPMADRNSLTFWQQVATTFRGNPRVWFELYNEPHDVSWSIWRNGGTVPAQGGTPSWRAAGMQQLYQAVRATGARNIVLAGGLNWAGDLTGLPTWQLDGYNIAYTVHSYFGGQGDADPVPLWRVRFGFAAARYPLVATEFGTYNCTATYEQNFIAYANQIGMGWTAWAWYPGGCGFPSLIENWSATPTVMGQAVRTALGAYRRHGA